MKKIFLLLPVVFLCGFINPPSEKNTEKHSERQTSRAIQREIRNDARYLVNRKYEQEPTIEKQISAILDKNEFSIFSIHANFVSGNIARGGNARDAVKRPPSRYKIREQFEELCIYGLLPLVDHIAKLEFVGILCDIRENIPPEELTRHLTRLWKSLRQDTIIPEAETREYISNYKKETFHTREQWNKYEKSLTLLERKQKLNSLNPIREALFYDTIYVFSKNYPETPSVFFDFLSETGYIKDLLAAENSRDLLRFWIMHKCPIQYFYRVEDYWLKHAHKFANLEK